MVSFIIASGFVLAEWTTVVILLVCEVLKGVGGLYVYIILGGWGCGFSF